MTKQFLLLPIFSLIKVKKKHLGFSHFQLNDVEEKRTKKNLSITLIFLLDHLRTFFSDLFSSFSSNFFFSNQTNVPKTIYWRTFISSSLFDLIITFIFLSPFLFHIFHFRCFWSKTQTFLKHLKEKKQKKNQKKKKNLKIISFFITSLLNILTQTSQQYFSIRSTFYNILQPFQHFYCFIS